MSHDDEMVRLHSGEYVDRYERKPASRLARLVPLMHLDRGEELVDFACGNAMLLPLVHEQVRHYHGVDFSPLLRGRLSRGAANPTFRTSRDCSTRQRNRRC